MTWVQQVGPTGRVGPESLPFYYNILHEHASCESDDHPTSPLFRQAYSAPVAVGGTLAYILAFALGAGPVTALIIPELNPAKMRGAS